MSQKSKANLLPAIFIISAVVVLVVIGSMYAFRTEIETIQGQAEADEYRVSSKVPGRVLEIRVREGQQVRAGDTLAILEAPDIEAKLVQAKAAESAAEAQNRKAEKGVRAEQVQAAYEMWQKARAGVTIAEKSYARISRLHEQGVVAAQKLDEVTAQRDAAVATEKAAKSQYDMARNGAEREDKAAAKALVDRARGAVSEVGSYMKETVLIASHDGEVSEIFPHIGELVGTGAPIMMVSMLDHLWVTFNVREDHLSRFGMGQVVRAYIPALGNKEVALKVYFLKDLGSFAAWKATKTTGQFDMKTFEVKASLDSLVEGLRPGMSVIAE